MFGPPQRQKISSEPLAAIAFLSVVAALCLGFLNGKPGQASAGGLAGLGAILLLSLKSKIEADVLKQAPGMIQVNAGAGFYLVFCLLLGAIAANAYGYFGGSAARLPSFARDSDHKFCPQCGARNASTVLFCQDCGTKFEVAEGTNA